MPSGGVTCEWVTVKSISTSTTSIEIIDWLLDGLISWVPSGEKTVADVAIPPIFIGATTEIFISTLELLGRLATVPVRVLLIKLNPVTGEAPPMLFCETVDKTVTFWFIVWEKVALATEFPELIMVTRYWYSWYICTWEISAPLLFFASTTIAKSVVWAVMAKKLRNNSKRVIFFLIITGFYIRHLIVKKVALIYYKDCKFDNKYCFQWNSTSYQHL